MHRIGMRMLLGPDGEIERLERECAPSVKARQKIDHLRVRGDFPHILVAFPGILNAPLAAHLDAVRRSVIDDSQFRRQMAPDAFDPRVDFGVGKVDHRITVAMKSNGDVSFRLIEPHMIEFGFE